MTVINAAREGARTSITTSDPTTIPSIARGAAQGAAAGIGGAGVTVASTCVALKTAGSCNWSTKTSSQPGDAVAVTVNYTYHNFFPLLFGATIPISATVQMVLE